jgi:CHAT domain-containing protein/tetratricopeptide (TPR) repeat protein
LGYAYLATDDPRRAEPLLKEALGILEKPPGSQYLEAVTTRKRLGLLCQSEGRFAEAEDNYRQALRATESRGGGESLTAMGVKVGLAQTLQSRGDARSAIGLMKDVLRIYGQSYHEHDPHWIDALGIAATAHMVVDETAEAERLLTHALRVCQVSLDRAGAYESERQRLLQMMIMRNIFDLYLSLPITARTQGSGLYPYVLAWKGATASREWRDRRILTDDMASLDAELRQITRRLSLLTLHPPEVADRRDWHGELFRLNMRKDLLEQQRASYSSDQQGPPAKVTVADVSKVLSPNMALVDFLQYTHTSFRMRAANPPVEMHKEQRYLAFVVRPGRPVQRIDLGPVAPIAEAVAKLRKTRGFRPDKGKTDWSVAVKDLIWPWLKRSVDDCDTLLISPDGALSHLAWNALPGRKPDTYLIEDFAIAMVPVPQLLPAMLAVDRGAAARDRQVNDSLLLVGDIDYNAPPSLALRASVVSSPTPHQPEAPARVLSPAGPMAFAPLAGTAAEVQALRTQFDRLFPGGKTLLLNKSAATEDAFWREAPRHRWLHIATHGFFAPPNVMAAIAAQTRPEAESRRREGVSVFQVGYLNGLALAGANTGPAAYTPAPAVPDAGDTVAATGQQATAVGDYAERKFDAATPTADGILTAAELATMDLRHVEVVVLSGCETGLGEVQGGEGALGMQRALQIAGVGATVGSLWTVPDDKTSLLMQRFYANLWEKKLPRLAALREAQLWMLRTGGKDSDAVPSGTPARRLSPHYWAAFTLSGDWR